MHEEKLSWETDEKKMVGYLFILVSHRNRSTVEEFDVRVAAAEVVEPSLVLLLLLMVMMVNSRTESKAVRLIR